MARILFGVAGQGYGHATRAKVITHYLEQQGHQVKIITYHQTYQQLRFEFDVTKIFGLLYAHQNYRASYWQTFWKNIKGIPAAYQSWRQLNILVRKFRPQLVITDLEPSSTLLAHYYHLPLLSIDNQHRLTRGKLEYKRRWLLSAWLNKIGVGLSAWGARAYLITTFFDFPLTKPRTYLVPPILNPSLLQTTPKIGKHILVYGTTTDLNFLLPLLTSRSETFFIYSKQRTRRQIQNCFFKPIGPQFLTDLASAQAVIASAGFTLIGEALHLGKPYLALPLPGRIEQLVNAYYLKKLGYGDYSENLTAVQLDNFLQKLPAYRQKLSTYPRHDNSQLYSQLDRLIAGLLTK